MSNETFTDARYAGYDNAALANLVEEFKSSNGARAFGEASDALRKLAAQLEDIDRNLRRELAKLGIEWQGLAGENAGQTIEAQAGHSGDMSETSQHNAQATMAQSEANSHARNSMPESQKLRGDTSRNLGDKLGGLVGYETDHAREVKETNAARQQTIDSLEGYSRNSQDAIDRFRDPGRPPNFEVTTTSSTAPPVAPVAPPGGHPPGIPGGVPGGIPGGTPGVGGNPTASNPTAPVPNLPGGSTGVAPNVPGNTSLGAGPTLPKPFGSPLPVAGAIGAAAASVASARRPRRRGPARSWVAAGVPAWRRRPRSCRQAPRARRARSELEPVPTPRPRAAPPTTAPHRTNAAAKGGAAAGKGAAGGLMSPVASGRGGPGEEDGEHVRKYGVDSDDVFGDERMVVQSVIGEEPKDKQIP